MADWLTLGPKQSLTAGIQPNRYWRKDEIIPASSVSSTIYKTVGRTNADYITDGVADQVQIQAAIDAVIALGGGTIFIKAATYDIADPIIIIGSNLIIRGEGTATKFVLANEVNEEIFCVGNASTACNNVSFYDFYMDGNKSNQTGTLTGSQTRNLIRYRSDAQNSYGGVVDGVYAYNGKQNGLSNESHQFLTFRNCRAEECDNHGIWFENANQMVVEHCWTQKNALAGIKGASFGDFSVIGCESKSDDGAGFSFLSCGRGNIIGNVAHRAGWHQDVGNTAADGFKFSACANIQFIGNSAYACQGDGLEINGTTFSTFSHNTFRRNGQLTNDTYSDIVLTNTGGGSSVLDNVFVGNTFRNDTAANFTNAAKYNISANSASTHLRNVFRDNQFGSPITSKIFNLHSTSGAVGANDSSFFNNRGLNPRQRYNYGFASTTPFTIDPVNGDHLVVSGYLGTAEIQIADGIFKGQEFILEFRQDTGNKLLTWASNIKWPGEIAPLLASAADDLDIMRFVWDGTNWNGSISSKANKLYASGTGELAKLVSTTDAARIGFYSGATNNAMVGIGGNGDILTSATADSLSLRATNAMHFATSGDNLRATITSDGDINIGASGSPGSKLTVQGPIATTYAAKTAAYTITATDSIINCNSTSAAFAVTLPTAVGCPGRVYTIKKTDASANAVTVDTTSSQTIDGASTKVLSNQYDTITVYSDNANWKVKVPVAATLTSLGVTASAAELNTLDGITATVTELNYTDGVTSAIQTQLNTKATMVTAPAAANSAGTAGQIAYDADFIYVCIATNTWERAAIASW